MEPFYSFGAWLKQRRRTCDLTQDQLARLVGCSVELISKLETDARRPSRQIAALLATQLGLPPADHECFVRVARGLLSPDQLPPPDAGRAPLAAPPTAAAPPAAPAPDRPDRLSEATLTFLFTDLEGSTRLWEQHPQAMRAALARHDALLRQIITARGGGVFKTVGDAVCAVFPTPHAALAAALAAQRVLRAEDWQAYGLSTPLCARMAVHSGVAESRDADFFGPPLNHVARLRDAAHGGQILVSHTTTELLHDHPLPDATLRNLGIQQLKDLSRPAPIFQLVAPGLPDQFPALRTLSSHPGNLPTPPTALIGRTDELAALAAILVRPDVRLLTLTGAGGAGKTRLALQAAAAASDLFPDGVWFVDLAAIHDPQQVAPAISRALALQDIGSQPPLARLKLALRTQSCLLLLDNCEQVTAAAPLLAELLAAAPGVRILATSRVPLHLRGEHVHVVPPLQLPARRQRRIAEPADTPPAAVLSQYEAVALFIARAEEADEQFTVTDANAPAIAEICWRLDGLPLAIELAAARVRHFPPEALLNRLERDGGLGVLTRGPRDLPERQQTLRATIAWSVGLLLPAEQTLLTRLGVFAGSFDLPALTAVVGEDALPDADLIEQLDTLLDQSLVQRQTADAEPRFFLLETVRAYAREQLTEQGTWAALQERMAVYYVALAEAAEPHLRRSEQLVWLARLDAEAANLQATLSWGLDAPPDATAARTLGLRLAGALWYYWFLRGRHGEAYYWLESAAAHDPALPAAVRARALLGASFISYIVTWGDIVRPGYNEGMMLAMQTGDPWLILFGQAMNPDPSIRAIARAETPHCDDPWLAAVIMTSVIAAWQQSILDFESTLTFLKNAFIASRQAGDRQQIVHIVCLINWYWPFENQDRQYIDGLISEAQQLAHEAGFHYSEAEIEAIIADTLFHRGQLRAALLHTANRLSFERALGNPHGIRDACLSLEWLAVQCGDFTTASVFLDEATTIGHLEYDMVSGLHIQCSELIEHRVHFYMLQGHLSKATELLHNTLAELDQLHNDRLHTGYLYASLGNVALASGKILAGIQWLEQALTDVQLAEDRRATVYAALCIAHSIQGDKVRMQTALAQAQALLHGAIVPWAAIPVYLAEARAYLAQAQWQESLQSIVAGLKLVLGGAVIHVPPLLERAAEVAAALHQPEAATRRLAAATTLRERLGTPPWPVDQPELATLKENLHAALGDAAFQAAWDAGAAAGWQETAAEAIEELASG